LQPEVKPGCILRRSNFNVLEREKLVDSKQVCEAAAAAAAAANG
jgi:hypothetical protein